MAFRTLISSGALALHLPDSAFVVVDCRFKLDDVQWGEREYEASHIPGAVYAHLDRDLSGPKTGANGRHPLPDPKPAPRGPPPPPAPRALGAACGRLGIGEGGQVVAYDKNNGMFGSRLW